MMQRFGKQTLRQLSAAAPLRQLAASRVVRHFAAGPQDVLDKYAALNAKQGGSSVTKATAAVSAGSPAEVLSRLQAFEAEVISANWADYLVLVYNMPFWEVQFEETQALATPLALPGSPIAEKLAEVQELMDVLYQCEDVRDHVNELCELGTRASGFMGTGYMAEEKVENLEEHAKLCGQTYEALLSNHPNFKPKIEQTVGHGLAILRSKHKFKFSSMHRYFF
eukprot:TRINITY_DN64406_c0_g1_i1.p1 TRINITY_DN64406_c0_g1~~TRINITY_DN64406_c0_g1_i1.p1  ORF type:complete len:223 (+),score=58.24 TRINITY_DN64406_c0_g1_i1:57-725(+)